MLEEKHFGEWMELKESLHNMGKRRTINEGEVWWCAMGENVGVEINGKSNTFARPILIYKKLGRLGFLGIPLTSQPHSGSWYVQYRFHGKRQIAVLAQIRVVSVARLYHRMGRIDDADMTKVRAGFHALFCGK